MDCSHCIFWGPNVRNIPVEKTIMVALSSPDMIIMAARCTFRPAPAIQPAHPEPIYTQNMYCCDNAISCNYKENV